MFDTEPLGEENTHTQAQLLMLSIFSLSLCVLQAQHVFSPVMQGSARMMAPPTHGQPSLVSSSTTQYPEQTHTMYGTSAQPCICFHMNMNRSECRRLNIFRPQWFLSHSVSRANASAVSPPQRHLAPSPTAPPALCHAYRPSPAGWSSTTWRSS